MDRKGQRLSAGIHVGRRVFKEQKSKKVLDVLFLQTFGISATCAPSSAQPNHQIMFSRYFWLSFNAIWMLLFLYSQQSTDRTKIYRIRPNFRGAQFSRIAISKHFAETIFADQEF